MNRINAINKLKNYIDTMDVLLKNGGDITEIFRSAANLYRKIFCNGKARPLLRGEIHPGCQNFSGPGTRIDLQEVLNYPPYNDIDKCSKQHDIEYGVAFNEKDRKKREQMIRESDDKVLECYDKYKNQESYTASKTGIKSKITAEKLLPSFLSNKIFGKYKGGKKSKKSKK